MIHLSLLYEMAYRYSGTAWDGQKWVAAKPIVALGTQVSSVPSRPTGADGTVASRAHDQNSPRSDHTPKPSTGTGTVRAIDVTVTNSQGTTITEAIRASRDKRLKYLIYKTRMFASYSNSKGPAWQWRPYTGGGHLAHFHVSTLSAHDSNGSAWDIGFEGGNGLLDFDIGAVGAPSVKGSAALALQLMLLSAGEVLPQFGADGSAGDETRAALKSYQSKRGISNEPHIVAGKTYAALYTG